MERGFCICGNGAEFQPLWPWDSEPIQCPSCQCLRQVRERHKSALAELGIGMDEAHLHHRHGNTVVRQCAAASLCLLSADVVDALAKDRSHHVRKVAASRPDLTDEAMGLLANDSASSVRLDLASNRNLSAEVAHYMISDDSYNSARLAILKHQHIDYATMQELKLSRLMPTRRAVAAHVACPPDILRDLVHDRDHSVYAMALRNPLMPYDVLYHVASRVGMGERVIAAAGNPGATAPILRSLHSRFSKSTGKGFDPIYRDHGMLALSRNPSTPTDITLDLIQSNTRKYAEGILAARPDDEALLSLVADAWNDTQPVADIATLRGMMNHNKMDDDLLSDLWSRTRDNTLQIMMAGHHRVGSRTLELILSSGCPEAQAEAVAQGHKVPVEKLKALAAGRVVVKTAVAACENTPPEILRDLASERNKQTRQCVAEHSAVPDDVLMLLAFDKVKKIATAAARNLASRQAAKTGR